MSATSLIGASVTITGEITADEPLTVAGRVNGTITVASHTLTVDAGGHVNADVKADTVVINGQVAGSLAATTRITVRDGAVIEGTVSAPLLTVAEGAQIQGKLDVAGRRAAGLKLAS